jgi:hypothetical protein
MELENVILSEVSQAQKAKATCSHSYADYRPKRNAVILLDMCHTLKGGVHRRDMEREGNQKLECG